MLIIVIFLMAMKLAMLYQKRMWKNKKGYPKANLLKKMSVVYHYKQVGS